MNLELSDEQRMLREAAIDALGRIDTVESAREAADGKELLDLWPVACEAGWSGLLVSEENGGAGLGLYDAMLVMTECGKRLTGAGLIGHLAATAALEQAAAAGNEAAAGQLEALASGEKRAAIVLAAPPTETKDWQVAVPEGGNGELPSASGNGSLSLTGKAGYQLDLAGADVLLVPAHDGDEVVLALVEPGATGVEVERLVRSDASRPLANISLRGAEATAVGDGEAAAAAWHTAQALLAADALGVSEAMLELSVEYAKDREAFARPIGSYQAVKHQIVEILHRAEKTRSLTIYIGVASETFPEELPLAAATARLAGEQAADYATRTCIAVHGGIGATWEHDAPFYWRRAQLSRLLLGGQGGAADRITTEAVARATAAEPVAA
jgi:alkylation response protein AidB-like acyl-CoA dehydrogenase